MKPKPLVTIVTSTIGRETLRRAIDSIINQTYQNIQHLVVSDGVSIKKELLDMVELSDMVDFIQLPYSTGVNHYYGHRIYGAATYLAKGELICFLDDDNWFDPDHIESMVDVINQGYIWSCSLRKIVDQEGVTVCNDECESLGKWKNLFGAYFVDVNCFMLPRSLAVQLTPFWYTTAGDPTQPSADGLISNFLVKNNYSYHSNCKFSVNYTVGSTAMTKMNNSKDFFILNNDAYKRKYGEDLPWNMQ